ncbi:SDR family NAD(P)-dependent oxidoreductase [Stomatohabitans albus]|uniref:SDR family NAD(P)-dependent oxidoreductase n=1 Tax=Stomatohabitans albus TaxID=3110766 RepID=UPI00300CD2BC
MTKNWTPSHIPDLTGQTWLITGATNGIGLETANMASHRGAHLILAARNVERATRVANRLGNAEVIHLDLDSLQSVQTAAEQVPKVDVLINNAGLTTNRRETTNDGFERQWGVNFLGPFHFTNLILNKVQRRIVVLGSVAHQWGELDLEDPNFEHRPWTKRAAYAQSKLADMLWGYELSKRLRASNHPSDVQIAHPGWAITNLGVPAVSQPMMERIANLLAPVVGQNAKYGALPTLYAATQPLPTGSYIGPNGPFQTRGFPTRVKRTATATNDDLAEQLWAYAEQAITSATE